MIRVCGPDYEFELCQKLELKRVLNLMQAQGMIEYLRIIRKWWWVIVLLVGTTVGTMSVIAFLTETKYQATVTLQVSAPPPQEVPLYSEFGRQALTDEIQQTRSSLNEFLQEGDVTYQTVQGLPDVKLSASDLRENLTIEVPDNSQLMRISVRAPDPDTAALLANTLVDVGLKKYGELRARPTVNTRKFIEQQLELARTELGDAEKELTKFQINNKVGALDQAISKQYDLIRSLSIERDLARAGGEVTKAQAIADIILEREAELQDMIGITAGYNELTDQVDRVRSNFNFLLDRKNEAQIKENQILELGSVQVITPARPPRNPVAAVDGKLIVLAAVVSFLTGILLTFLIEYLVKAGNFRSAQRLSEQSKVVALSDSAGQMSH